MFRLFTMNAVSRGSHFLPSKVSTMAATWWVQKDEVEQSLGVVLPKRNQVYSRLASSILTTGGAHPPGGNSTSLLRLLH
jgi:hypothetical protein